MLAELLILTIIFVVFGIPYLLRCSVQLDVCVIKYKSAIALTVDDARRLLEDGWQFVCNVDNHPLFKKGV
jgi:hypothetical protein